MRILGIDPGLRTTGFGVLDVEGAALRYVASGVIQTSSEAQGDLPARLKVLHPLPRVNEISPDVDATPHAGYFEQARNGVIMRQVLILDLLDARP